MTDRSAEPSRRSLRALGLNKRQIEALRLMVNEGQELSNADCRRLFQMGRNCYQWGVTWGANWLREYITRW